MFDRFTPRAARAIELAVAEAKVRDHAWTGTGHLLVGVLGVEEDGTVTRTLTLLGVAVAELRQAGEDLMRAAEREVGTAAPFSPGATTVLRLSLREAFLLDDDRVDSEHLLLALLDGTGDAAVVLAALGLDQERLRAEVVRSRAAVGAVVPAELGTDLTAAARAGRLDPVAGRDDEVDQVMRLLSGGERFCPVLVGEPDVDPSSVVRRLAHVLAGPAAPALLRAAVVLVPVLPLDLDALRAHEDVILFVADLHALDTGTCHAVVAGAARLIGSTTPAHYGRLAQDPVLTPVLRAVRVLASAVSDAVALLRADRDRYASRHRVAVTDEALGAAAALAHEFVADPPLPDSAFAVLEEAAATVSLRARKRPARLLELDDLVAEARWDKDAGIEAQDFEAAADARGRERELLAAREDLETRWRAGELPAPAPVVDAELVVLVVAQRAKVPVSRVRAALPTW